MHRPAGRTVGVSVGFVRRSGSLPRGESEGERDEENAADGADGDARAIGVRVQARKQGFRLKALCIIFSIKL